MTGCLGVPGNRVPEYRSLRENKPYVDEVPGYRNPRNTSSVGDLSLYRSLRETARGGEGLLGYSSSRKKTAHVVYVVSGCRGPRKNTSVWVVRFPNT